MTTTLDRPTTTEAKPRTARSFEPTSKRRRRSTRRVVAGIATGALALFAFTQLPAPDAVIDESHQFVETQRMLALAPTDTSVDHAEHQRMTQLAPTTDTSVDHAEHQRMTQLAPTTDTSVDQAEHQRMIDLAP